MSARCIFLADEQATLQAGEALAQALQTRREARARVIYLEGQLGAGKTTLTRGVLQALGHRGKVKSPTYTLVEPYALACGVVYHFDLYRLKDPAELEFIGVQEYFDQGCLCLVEWPERGANEIPAPDVVAALSVEGSGRQLDLSAHSDAGEKILAALSAQAFTAVTK